MKVAVGCLWLVLALLSPAVAGKDNSDSSSRSVFPRRMRPAGLKSPRKCWWAKEITLALHVSGHLTERQIKYAADCGFKTILSLFTYGDGEPPQTFGGDPLPNTAASKVVVEKVAGLKYVTLLDPMDEWASLEAVQKLSQVLPNVRKPVLLHCDRGYTVTFVTLMYLANATRHDPTFTPRITSKDVYNISAAMGLDFLSRIPQEVVSEITGEPVPESPTRPNTDPEEWMDYWPAHPVYKNWFTSGQITPAHLPVMVDVGFKTLVNLRSGIVLDGKPNQEEVNLLNIQHKTGTYARGETKPRQWKDRLEETRLDAKRANSFISPSSPVNYESTNVEEFGDEVGYQETRQRTVVQKFPTLDYHHMPIDPNGPYGVFIDREMSRLLKLSQQGPLLVQCASGQRAAFVAVLGAAVQYDLDLDWALRRAQELGYTVSETKTPELYRTYVDWLVTRRRVRDEL